jgi:hypothetical protein
MSEKVELPPKYYWENFRYLAAFVQRHYGHLLTEAERGFYEVFVQLSEDAQCLFVRFSNRRGAFFRTNKLKYAEIQDLEQSLRELVEGGFVTELSLLHEPRIGEALDVFTKTELLQLAKWLELLTKGKGSLKKEELLDYLLENATAADLVEALQAAERIVKVNFEAETMLFKFLFFGNRHADMTEFVVRDLGLMRFEPLDEANFVPHFQNRQEAEDRLRLSLVKEDFYMMKEAQTEPDEIFRWFVDWNDQKGSLSDFVLPAYDRLVLRVGAHLERQKANEQALAVYELTQQAPSRERQVRLLTKMGSDTEALKRCEEILQQPQNADELFFAQDFTKQQAAKSQKKRVKKSTTNWLHASETVRIDVAWKYQVEQGVAAYFQQQGSNAYFSENFLWNGLFGLLFWDVIFDTSVAAFHHPLQRSPSDLYKPIFFEKRRGALLERLDYLDDTPQAVAQLTASFEAKYGTQNPMVFWSPDLLSMCVLMLQKLPADGLKKVLLEMATNLRENTRGFPDLFVWEDTDYSFVEVKSPTDHLSSQQLYWLHFFERVGIKSKVLRVEWLTQLDAMP